MDQNYKNVKKTIQVGLHWVQGGHYWVTWYSMGWTLNKQVLHYALNPVASPLPVCHHQDNSMKGKYPFAVIQSNIGPIDNDGSGSGLVMPHTEPILQSILFEGHLWKLKNGFDFHQCFYLYWGGMLIVSDSFLNSCCCSWLTEPPSPQSSKISKME